MVALPTKSWSLGSSLAEGNRDALAKFWLAAPVDQLQTLWSSEFGQASMALIGQLTPDSSFTPEQVAIRESINERLRAEGLQQPCAPQLLLAAFLYSPPGLMTIANPEQNLPAWLAAEYKKIYEGSSSATEPVQPDTVSRPVQAENVPASNAPQSALPDFGPFPSSLQELVGNRVQLNRILGLSNLYYIDPEDQEILGELRQLRSQLVDLILQAPEPTLEQIWASDFGDRFWAMVRSGVQKETLADQDERYKALAVQKLDPNAGGGFGKPGAINAFLVSMLYYLPGTMKVDDAQSKLPNWLFPHYEQLFAAAITSK
ncbi:hypothetical protein [Prochlorococcus sp. MIT 1300]|uniref:hypothetical protein n=1 Tax=Prochlorococcus sp. MIT 1300 TaxID=3096218 RepID=UPI002A751F3E|nr:hypothetical protein [Prochlorococcus sp. MIT 1300]